MDRDPTRDARRDRGPNGGETVEFGSERFGVDDFRVPIDWERNTDVRYAIDAFERKKESRELGKYREVWGSWRDDE